MKKLTLLILTISMIIINGFSLRTYAKSNKYALIIAVGNYDRAATGWSPISSENDIPLIKTALEGQGFDEKNITEDIEIGWRLLSQGYKIREELETQISDGIVLESIFKRMGYKKIREVKKERKFLNYNNCLITIDIFKKIGFVIEIEGTQHDIEKTISFFSLNRQRFKAQTYTDVLKLYHISKEKKIKTIKNEKP